MTRKKSLVVSFMGLALIALSVLVSFFSCQKSSAVKGSESPQPHYIQQYVERPEFKSAIWAVPSQAESKTSTGQFVVVVKVNEDEGADTHVVNYKREPERFLTYAKRYNDLSYNRPIPAPNSNGALAEPLSKVQCYEMSSTGELVDVSSKVVLRALTFLPYIKSGYKDRESVEMPKTDGMPSRYGPRDYLVNKTLSSLTEEDLTLLDYQSFSYLFELIPIAPYKFEKNSQIKVVISESGKTHETIARYAETL